jgi:hypothetical protein
MRVAIGELTLKDIYKKYKEGKKNPLDYKEFREICYMHNQLFMERVLVAGERMRIPFRLGFIRVKKTKMNYKYMMFDYETFNKTGEKVFHMNDHSDDFKARILWEKSKCIVPGKRPYCLRLTREYKRKLASIMKTPNGHNRYLTY